MAARMSIPATPSAPAAALNSLFAQRSNVIAADPFNSFNFGGPSSSTFPGIQSFITPAPASSSLQTNVRTANLGSITSEQEPISPTKLMDRFSAIAPQSDV
eukprot:CAMPEP_0184357696 /NCGR_PEP_ID=MMETSP1089-20130417/110296_1 /TAXON_ID=38269 ORGANISM="Gloeochaete wittrockiana, Strain SAG46.84" /NCGR_SAMPLE_ID=MMETSP1089 /ASSEMBLY_ACC=CAM_ASM_000445 /LENGTH=100 /DNA_ID=CAMNT_0026695611 /DNA_START=16 /DNA_END=314 /DNA_ORIENTATION=+